MTSLLPSDEAHLQRLSELTDSRDQDWQFIFYLNTVTTRQLYDLLSHKFVKQMGKTDMIQHEIMERQRLEPESLILTPQLLTQQAPLLAQIIGEPTPPRQIVFARAAAFCNCDMTFLVRMIEQVLAEKKSNGGNFCRMLHASSAHWETEWEHRPRNEECLTLTCVLNYLQVSVRSLRHLLAPHLNGATRNSDGYVYIGKKPKAVPAF